MEYQYANETLKTELNSFLEKELTDNDIVYMSEWLKNSKDIINHYVDVKQKQLYKDINMIKAMSINKVVEPTPQLNQNLKKWLIDFEKQLNQSKLYRHQFNTLFLKIEDLEQKKLVKMKITVKKMIKLFIEIIDAYHIDKKHWGSLKDIGYRPNTFKRILENQEYAFID